MINWEEQWSLFAPHFQDGRAHIDLKLYGFLEGVLQLIPGPGFGDCSHPTTQLMLCFLGHRKMNTVVDVGCGSGILSAASIYGGAKRVFGIDIDKHAVGHAQENFYLNNAHEAEGVFGLHLPPSFEVRGDLTVCMNMIASEQKKAWEAQGLLYPLSKTIFTSGVLVEEKESYLSWAKGLGWNLVECKEREGWLGFEFIHK